MQFNPTPNSDVSLNPPQHLEVLPPAQPPVNPSTDKTQHFAIAWFLAIMVGAATGGTAYAMGAVAYLAIGLLTTSLSAIYMMALIKIRTCWNSCNRPASQPQQTIEIIPIPPHPLQQSLPSNNNTAAATASSAPSNTETAASTASPEDSEQSTEETGNKPRKPKSSGIFGSMKYNRTLPPEVVEALNAVKAHMLASQSNNNSDAQPATDTATASTAAIATPATTATATPTTDQPNPTAAVEPPKAEANPTPSPTPATSAAPTADQTITPAPTKATAAKSSAATTTITVSPPPPKSDAPSSKADKKDGGDDDGDSNDDVLVTKKPPNAGTPSSTGTTQPLTPVPEEGSVSEPASPLPPATTSAGVPTAPVKTITGLGALPPTVKADLGKAEARKKLLAEAQLKREALEALPASGGKKKFWELGQKSEEDATKALTTKLREEHLKSAIRYYKKSSEIGYVPAFVAHGRCCLLLGDEPHKIEAFQSFQEGKNRGYLPAQVQLATCYEQGKGIHQNLDTAVRFFRDAADKLDPEAEYALGLMYLNGNAVIAKDPKKAYELCKSSADQGNPEAIYSVGYCYHAGEGVTADLAVAKQWYEKVKDKLPNAAYSLYKIADYENIPSAVKEYLELAAKLGHEEAKKKLAEATKLK